MFGSRGFTLIELIVTIAVLGILAAIAAPAMGDLIAQQRLNSAAKDLSYTLGQARSQAAVLRREVIVGFEKKPNTSTNYYWYTDYTDLQFSSTAKQMIFSPIGVGSSRITNPNYNKAKQEAIGNPLSPNYDPAYVSQNETIVVPQLQTFRVCSKSLKASKIINISKTGIIEKIESQSGVCP